MVEGLEMICFKIISNVGGARSSYIEAIQKAKQGDFEGAGECIKTGQEMFLAGHEAHFELIQKEAQGEQVEIVGGVQAAKVLRKLIHGKHLLCRRILQKMSGFIVS